MTEQGESDVFAGRFELLEELASGGTATIYRARHIVSLRVLALKVMAPRAGADAVARERFMREASAPAQIGHPAVVEVFDAGIDDVTGSPFVAMELLEGRTLRQRLKEGGLSLEELLDIANQILEPLAVAHHKGFVHRDLKPENVFLERGPGRRPRVRLLDFGLTRHRTSKSVTDVNSTLGTPNYMSPEQVRDPTGCGPSTDVWAMGVMLYEALAGRRPYHADNKNAVVVQIVMEEHVPLGVRQPRLSDAVVDLVESCLRKAPEDRPADAGALLDLVRKVQRGLPRGLEGTSHELPPLRSSAEYTVAEDADHQPTLIPSSELPTAEHLPRPVTPEPAVDRPTHPGRLSLLETIRESLLPTKKGN